MLEYELYLTVNKHKDKLNLNNIISMIYKESISHKFLLIEMYTHN